ncbi:recombinase family protein [Chloroflexota bacterium]
MRAVIYARVSTDEQVEGYSIDAQLRAGRNFAHEKEWGLINEYVDEGKSARSEDITRRPKFQEMLKAASEKEFDVLIVHKLDRFSRNLLVTLRSFDELSKRGITFISITEQIDFTTPMGRVFLAMAGAFAQFYSDNLSQETKKGWTERKTRGLYGGTLPFGASKGEDGVPIPDMQERNLDNNGSKSTLRNYEGLQMAFEQSAQGKSDREIAIALNTAGYRTTGTHGPRPFSKDTIKNMLKNRFYLGYIPGGNGGWLKAKHAPFVKEELFEEAQKLRARRTTNRVSIRSDATIYSLSGIARCAPCGNTLRSYKGRGRVRLICNGRIRGEECTQPSNFLDIYEEQLTSYLAAFQIPLDYQDKILAAHRKLDSPNDVKKKETALKTRLERLDDLYQWGHKSKEQYLIEYAAIKKELPHTTQTEPKFDVLESLATFLKDIVLAWKVASQKQRNRLASSLFETVWIKDKKVLAVTPRPEFKPFFDLQYAGKSNYELQVRPRGGSGFDAISKFRILSSTSTNSTKNGMEREVITLRVA